jgi:hypothetical protein
MLLFASDFRHSIFLWQLLWKFLFVEGSVKVDVYVDLNYTGVSVKLKRHAIAYFVEALCYERRSIPD